MCVQDQLRSPIEHALLASCAGRWREWTLVLFNVYIDDSGTAPSQRIAIASALIIPARVILRLESEWENFCSKHGISEFHASECAYRNRKSQFASWDDARVSAAFARIRQITMKYAVQAISFAMTKADFDEEMPDRWKDFIGRNHYVWAVWNLLKLVRMWTEKAGHRVKTEFVFDYLQGEPRKEIENAMSQMEIIIRGLTRGITPSEKDANGPDSNVRICSHGLVWAQPVSLLRRPPFIPSQSRPSESTGVFVMTNGFGRKQLADQNCAVQSRNT